MGFMCILSLVLFLNIIYVVYKYFFLIYDRLNSRMYNKFRICVRGIVHI